MTVRQRQKTFWPVGPISPLRMRTNAAVGSARPTEVYDTLWYFAAERQATFYRRHFGAPQPWSDDDILQTYKFTNAYRASDRVSQYLIRHVIYNGPQSPEEVFFRTILFKLFNKIETWELLKQMLGELTYSDYSFERYDQVLSDAMAQHRAIYSAAYIMPSGSRKNGTTKKHRAHLQLLQVMMENGVPDRIAAAESMQEAFLILRSYPMIGDFLAYQYVTDLNYSEICHFSEMDFVVPGPGAIDGISKCFSSLGCHSPSEIIRMVAARQAQEFDRLGLHFQDLWGRPLQLIDCQNLFCEISKYSRVRHPHIAGVAHRTRIKQKYKSNNDPLPQWYPPKWGINELITSEEVTSHGVSRLPNRSCPH